MAGHAGHTRHTSKRNFRLWPVWPNFGTNFNFEQFWHEFRWNESKGVEFVVETLAVTRWNTLYSEIISIIFNFLNWSDIHCYFAFLIRLTFSRLCFFLSLRVDKGASNVVFDTSKSMKCSHVLGEDGTSSLYRQRIRIGLEPCLHLKSTTFQHLLSILVLVSGLKGLPVKT